MNARVGGGELVGDRTRLRVGTDDAHRAEEGGVDLAGIVEHGHRQGTVAPADTFVVVVERENDPELTVPVRPELSFIMTATVPAYDAVAMSRAPSLFRSAAINEGPSGRRS